MALLYTPDKKDGFIAPEFELKNIDGKIYSLDECLGTNGTVIMFICNHCPYVIAIIDRIVKTCIELEDQGIGSVAIMSNDTNNYPDDSFENMKVFAKKYGLPFPYLIDETQEIAKVYEAICTPDFFGFDRNRILQYRGRLDSSNNKPSDDNTVPELLNAMIEIKNNETVTYPQSPSMGCSIKWK